MSIRAVELDADLVARAEHAAAVSGATVEEWIEVAIDRRLEPPADAASGMRA